MECLHVDNRTSIEPSFENSTTSLRQQKQQKVNQSNERLHRKRIAGVSGEVSIDPLNIFRDEAFCGTVCRFNVW